MSIEIENLSYWYPDTEVAVLKDINLQIQKGEFVLLFGPSGCGKSTLSLTINGVVPHAIGGKIEGRVMVCGLRTFEHKVKDLATKVGMVFQSPDSQLVNMRVSDEIVFGLQNLRVNREEMRERLNEALEFVDMDVHKNKFIYNLSGGQKQRTAIAAALAMQPEILVLDEPTVHLDPHGSQEVVEILHKLNKDSDITILLIEHKIDQVIDMVDRILLMNDGMIVDQGSPREVFKTNGEFVMNKLGLFIPQMSELALAVRREGYNIDPFPLGVDELKDVGFKFRSINVVEESKIGKSLIEVSDLSFTYPNDQEALRDISLRINEGEIVAVVGPNGSGKTTLTKIFVGLLKPTKGKVTVCGLDVKTASTKELCRFIGYSFQNPEHQFLEDNAYDEVAFGLNSYSFSNEEKARRVMDILYTMGLEGYVKHHPMNLSMGQKRRLSIATMLILEPKILVLDEPMTGQDKKRAKDVINLLSNLKQKGITAIIVTHDMDFVSAIADRVLVINNRTKTFEGTPKQLFSSQRIFEEANLRDPPIHRLAQKYGLQDILRVDEFIQALDVRR